MGKRSREKGQRAATPPAVAPQPRAAQQPRAAPRPRILRDALLVAVVAILPYLNAIPNGFVLDDELIEKDQRIHTLDLDAIFDEGYWARIDPNSPSDVYRPLTVASYAVNYAVTGPRPAFFHAVNVILHAGVSVLVLLLLVDAPLGRRAVATGAALLFATHPVHTEAVAGVVGRAELLAAGFLLAALWLHARDYALGGLARGVGLAVSLGAFFLALLSKETAIAGPGLVLLIGLVQALRGADRRASLGRGARVAGLWVAVIVFYLAKRYAVLGTVTVGAAVEPGLLHNEGIVARVLTGLHVLAVYARLLVWPVTLSADYSYRQIPVVHSPEPMTVLGLGLAAALAAWLMRAYLRRDAPVVLGLGLFALTYVVVSNLVIPIGVLVAERLLYLPSVGFCVVVAVVGVRLLERVAGAVGARAARWVPAAALAAVLVAYGARTWMQNVQWYDEETLYEATVAASPESAAAHYRYGTKLLARPSQIARARAEFERALEIRPRYYRATINLIHAHLRLDEPDRALEVARRELATRPRDGRLQSLIAEAERRRESP